MKRSILTTAALAGIVAVGSLAATVTPARADDHHGNFRDRGQVVRRDDRDWHRDWRPAPPVYSYPAPVYTYPQPVYPAYPYGYVPSSGYVHVRGPGLGVGFSL